MMRMLIFIILPVIAVADEPIDLVEDLKSAPTPEIYHAMCAAAYALLAAEASGNRPYQAQLDTYVVEHDKKTDPKLSMLMAGGFRSLLDEGRISTADLNKMADKCEL